MSPSPRDPAQEGRHAVLAAGLRLPQARAGLAYGREDAGNLGARAASELLSRTAIDPAMIDEVIVGCVGPPHDQANIGRVIGLRAGVPRSVPGKTIGRNCASGMDAVTTAVSRVEAGQGRLFLCLGVEVMSAYPLIYGHEATGFFGRMMRARTAGQRLAALLSLRPSFFAPRIAITEGLTDPVVGMIMGSTAELLTREFAITREEQDEFAVESHRRAAAARDSGRMAREIVPYLPLGARSGDASLEHDDGIRDDQSMEALAKLKPYFEKPDGSVTVGNACQVTDGVTALLVASEECAHELGLDPLAAVRAHSWAGCDPERMGLGPVYSSAKALEAAGCELSDVGVFEINEAFAAQVIACRRAAASTDFARAHLGRDTALGEIAPEQLNKNGGAIAIGHPVGASGARLLLTLAHELEVSDCELGLASLCVGGGQGGAVLLERMGS